MTLDEAVDKVIDKTAAIIKSQSEQVLWKDLDTKIYFCIAQIIELKTYYATAHAINIAINEEIKYK